MVQNFKIENIHDYSQLVQTEKIQNILNNIPDGLSKLEKAYYVYIELGKILSEDPNYVLASTKNQDKYYNEPIDEEYYGICKSISELYVTILQDERIGIEADLVRQMPESVTKTHVDTILKIDGKYYMVNLVSDLMNIKSNRRLNSFARDLKRIMESRKQMVIKSLLYYKDDSTTDEQIIDMVNDTALRGDYELLYEFAGRFEPKESKNRKIYALVNRMKIINQYSNNINEEYGSIESLSRADTEKMDLKLGYSYGRIKSENGENERGIYTNDVFYQLQKELEDPEKVKKYIFDGKEIPKEEVLDYKLEYICKNIDKFIETTADMNYLEQIMNFSRVAENFISKEESERIVQYAIKIGKSNRDVVSVIKVKPMNEEGNNTYYVYSKEEKTYNRKTAQELKDYLNQFNSDDVHILGTFRFYSERLDSLNDKKQIEDELEV